MESKEALKQICTVCERHLGLSQKRCPFRSISNEYCDEYNGLLKDLDKLEKYDKAKELIKKKKVYVIYVFYISRKYARELWLPLYNNKEPYAHQLTQEEFDFILEVFK